MDQQTPTQRPPLQAGVGRWQPTHSKCSGFVCEMSPDQKGIYTEAKRVKWWAVQAYSLIVAALEYGPSNAAEVALDLLADLEKAMGDNP